MQRDPPLRAGATKAVRTLEDGGPILRAFRPIPRTIELSQHILSELSNFMGTQSLRNLLDPLISAVAPSGSSESFCSSRCPGMTPAKRQFVEFLARITYRRLRERQAAAGATEVAADAAG